MANKFVMRLHVNACPKCWEIFLQAVPEIGGIDSCIINVKEGTLTVEGDGDAVCVANALRRKFSEAVLKASQDGTIYAMARISGNIVWSFPSGSSLASHQTFSDDENDDNSRVVVSGECETSCADVTKLLPKTPAELVKSGRHLSPDGSHIIGCKITTGFLINAKTGNIIHKYVPGVPPPTDEANKIFPYKSVVSCENIGNSIELGTVDLSSMEPIFITRTDYYLTSIKANLQKVQWNVSIAEIDAIGVGFSGITVPGASDRHSGFLYWLRFGLVARLFVICMSLINWIGRSVKQMIKRNKKQLGSSKKKRDRKSNNNKNGTSDSNNIKKQLKLETKDLQTTGLTLSQNTSSETLRILEQRKEEPCLGAGRWIGRLFVSDRVIDNGSNGTIILEGCFDGRNAAVKRIVKAYYEAAWKEIGNLIASDQHPNIVRWYGVEDDDDFVYVALERCNCSLSDFIMTLSKSVTNDMHGKSEATNSLQIKKIEQVSLMCEKMNINLWTDDGCASQQMLNLMRDVVSGLSHLHDLGIIHRDLKPQNILITAGNGLCAKLSDMGISKRLANDASSLGHHATGIGSSGWQAPEQILHGRQTRAVDLFSLGSLLFFCITGGKHPFGAEYERDGNIVIGQYDLFPIKDMPEAADLVTRLLDSAADQRPRATEVLQHPFFWSSEKRLSFLREASDRLELEKQMQESDLLQALESVGSLAIGGTWDGKLDSGLLENIGRYRRYKFDSVKDLLRFIRNKSNHYWESPNSVQELLGTIPEGFENYFRSRFPKLLFEVYKVFSRHCSDEECFKKYFRNCTI